MRQVVNLTFDKQPMHLSKSGFWASFVLLGSIHTVSIHRETEKTKCFWEFATNGKVVVRRTAQGIIAARNAAQRWFAEEKTARRQFTAKGRAA